MCFLRPRHDHVGRSILSNETDDAPLDERGPFDTVMSVTCIRVTQLNRHGTDVFRRTDSDGRVGATNV
jgi:hypothetical protein